MTIGILVCHNEIFDDEGTYSFDYNSQTTNNVYDVRSSFDSAYNESEEIVQVNCNANIYENEVEGKADDTIANPTIMKSKVQIEHNPDLVVDVTKLDSAKL